MEGIMKIVSTIFVLCTIVLLLSGCGGYNTDHTPPDKDAAIKSVFPAEIDGIKGKFKRSKGIGGVESVYGDKMVIRLISMKNKNQADIGFQKEVLTKIDKMPVKASGKINGRWKASGTDQTGRKWYAWTRQNYIYVINGKNKIYLEKVVDAFPYISK